MARMWYYSSKSQQKGPVTWDELSGLAQAGQLRGSDLVWQEGTPDWVKASTVSGLIEAKNGRVATDVRADEPGPRRLAGRDGRDKDSRDSFRDDRPRRSIRKPKESSRGLMIGLIAGGGALLVVAVVVIIIIVANSGGDGKKTAVAPKPKPGPVPGPGPIDRPIDVPPGARILTATREGTRAADALAATDPHDPVRGGCFCKIYQVQFAAGRSYTIDLTAGFDPMLRVLDPAGTQVAFNDDWGGSLDSKIIFTPIVAGQYRIVCTTFSAGATGPFTLILREN